MRLTYKRGENSATIRKLNDRFLAFVYEGKRLMGMGAYATLKEAKRRAYEHIGEVYE